MLAPLLDYAEIGKYISRCAQDQLKYDGCIHCQDIRVESVDVKDYCAICAYCPIPGMFLG